MKKSGFTMIEFLVVAALIAILMTIGVGTYTRSLSRGRDAKRISDIKEAQKIFELYYSVNNTYAAHGTMFDGKDPSPPAGGLQYFCVNCNATDYLYCSRLENGSDYGNYTCNTDDPLTAVCNAVSTGQTHYCVASVQ